MVALDEGSTERIGLDHLSHGGTYRETGSPVDHDGPTSGVSQPS